MSTPNTSENQIEQNSIALLPIMGYNTCIKLKETKEQKRGLMQRSLSGEVRVKV